jgi:hypothetical protein
MCVGFSIVASWPLPSYAGAEDFVEYEIGQRPGKDGIRIGIQRRMSREDSKGFGWRDEESKTGWA